MNDLEHDMRQILASMATISYGTTTSWNSSGRGKPGDRPPTGEAFPLHEEWTRRWNQAPVAQRPAVVTEAREALDTYRVQRAREIKPETPRERRERILGFAGWRAVDVAREMRGPVSEVHAARADVKDPKVDLELGLPVPDAPDVRVRVLALADRHCSLKQIADQVGVSKSTVQRLLTAAA